MATRNVNEMKYSKRREICKLLDIDAQWKLLEEIDLTVDEIQHLSLAYIRPDGSPTSDLLTRWSHRNATIEMLASCLVRLKLLRAAEVLRDMVPDSVLEVDPVPFNNLRVESPKQNGIQVQSECDLPLPFMTGESGPPDNKQGTKLYSHQSYGKPVQDWSQQKPNISREKSERLPSFGKDSKHLSTCSNNVEAISFYPPSQSGKVGKDLNFPTSPVFRRVPIMHSPPEAVESPDVTTSVPEQQKSPEVIRKPDDSITSINHLSNIIIRYPYADIVAATNRFNSENLLGHGGFGVVYRGNIRKTPFAIKILHKREDPSSCRDFLAEINSLLKYRQKNIIMLSGCSIDGPAICLVYEYMVNGSLQDRLECKNKSKPLSWMIRHSILKDTAAGLQYLHTVDVKPLIHGDIKSANILLGPHFEAKISDFGLSKPATGGTVTGKLTHVTRQQFEKVYGSRAYLPEEFFTGGYQFNIKTDTYSFGIVIFETSTGEMPDDARREGGKLLNDFVRNVMADNESRLLTIKDRKAPGWPNELWLSVMLLGVACTSAPKRKRPSMEEVHGHLERLHQHMQVETVYKHGNGMDGETPFSQPNSFAASERSYHMSHHSDSPLDQIVETGNHMPCEMLPIDLQRAYDNIKFRNGGTAKDVVLTTDVNNTTILYASDPQKLQEIEEDFGEFSLNDDGHKAFANSHSPVVSDDRGYDSQPLKYIEVDTCKINSDVNFEEKNLNSTSLEKITGFSRVGLQMSAGCRASECMQNYVNAQIEGAAIKSSLHCQDGSRTCPEDMHLISNSTKSVFDDGVTDELEMMKKKEFPDFMKEMYNQMLYEDQETRRLDDDYEEETQEKEEEEEDCSDNSEISYENEHRNQNSLSDQFVHHFQNKGNDEENVLPPLVSSSCEAEDHRSVEVDTGENECSRRPACIAKEDLLRIERLEKLRRLRQQNS